MRKTTVPENRTGPGELSGERSSSDLKLRARLIELFLAQLFSATSPSRVGAGHTIVAVTDAERSSPRLWLRIEPTKVTRKACFVANIFHKRSRQTPLPVLAV
jgi:hypothetical protein